MHAVTAAGEGFEVPLRTKLLGIAVVGTAGAFLAAEVLRIYRLGRLPEHRGEQTRRGPLQSLARLGRVVREGYQVSRARRNAVFNMLASFVISFGTVRVITVLIRTRGGIGPIRNVQMGSRHIHHFIPGMLVSFAAGGVALGSSNNELRTWLAVPFGAGVALVLDETALLLQLEDVYWSEEGVLSVQVAFWAIALLVGAGYGVQLLRAGSNKVLEADWQSAARAWDDLARLSGEPA